MADTMQHVLERRSRDLVRDLCAAELLLGRIGGALGERVSNRMRTRIAIVKLDVEDLKRFVGEAVEDPAGGWAYLHATRASVDDLIEECLRLVAGAATRSLGLDDGYCVLADALVDELVAGTPAESWGSFTIIGRSEEYSRASRIIQVRAPATSIWELPVVVHELGHFVGPALVLDVGRTTEHPLDALFARHGDASATSWSWMQELFADVFATYVLGPAYAFTCAAEVFDPLLAHAPTCTHPPAEQRVRAIAATLHAAGSSDMTWYAGELTELWDQLVLESGGAEGWVPVGESPYTGPIIGLVTDNLPISRWQDWASAESVSAALIGAADGASGGAATIADILNGAWMARRGTSSSTVIDDIGQQAVARIRGIAAGGH